MVEFYLNNQQMKIPVDPKLEKILEQVVTRLMEQEGKTGPGEMSVTLVDDHDIRELNRIYRQQDKVTDVLSFPADDMLTDLDADTPRIWGDVVVSLERALEQSTEYGHSFCREVAFLVAHGVLHLLGYDHQDTESAEIMEAKGEQVLILLGIGREKKLC